MDRIRTLSDSTSSGVVSTEVTQEILSHNFESVGSVGMYPSAFRAMANALPNFSCSASRVISGIAFSRAHRILALRRNDHSVITKSKRKTTTAATPTEDLRS